ncbi:hypothetical protein KX935_03645 [Streptobacillus moniliformis]|uniref:PBECR4 domain-containing protein n=1 Tax=Streptobacillus moniliformis TaxID=34105 RepID=UPI0007E4547A|nr:PBECR4 domain-containing protein [Streptobacillus moniliformis]QXW66313.1 hypothetical protein KX935_03645 [Streptobacillus moniliformis]
MEKTYKVQEILNEIQKLNTIYLRIKGESKEFDIRLGIENIPHLLGLHYMEIRKIQPMEKIELIFDNNLSDEDILDRVEEYRGKKQRINVENRINTFEYFMNNLEKGVIVEKTLETKMDVNYLIVQSKEDDYYHLGIFSSDNGVLLLDFDELSEKEKDIIKTYFVEKDIKNEGIKYWKNTNIMENILSISIYDEKLKKYIPFSFDEEKNRALLKEYDVNKNFNYKEFLKEFENNKENTWNVKDEKNKDLER